MKSFSKGLIGFLSLFLLVSLPSLFAIAANTQSQTASTRSEQDKDLVNKLNTQGPQIQPLDNTTPFSFSIQGFVKGDWPMVIDYEMDQSGFVLIEINKNNIEPFYWRVDGSQPGRREEIIWIPERFGDEPSPAQYSIRAFSDNLGAVKPIPLRVYGFGAGDRARSTSLAIDELVFKPEKVVAAQDPRATYKFRARNDFQRIVIEFNKITRKQTDLLSGTLVKQIEHNGRRPVSAGEFIEGTWNGTTEGGEPSVGRHRLQIRGWMSSAEKDWQIARSRNVVNVSR